MEVISYTLGNSLGSICSISLHTMFYFTEGFETIEILYLLSIYFNRLKKLAMYCKEDNLKFCTLNRFLFIPHALNKFFIALAL